jgi:hypothetical protein
VLPYVFIITRSITVWSVGEIDVNMVVVDSDAKIVVQVDVSIIKIDFNALSALRHANAFTTGDSEYASIQAVTKQYLSFIQLIFIILVINVLLCYHPTVAFVYCTCIDISIIAKTVNVLITRID